MREFAHQFAPSVAAICRPWIHVIARWLNSLHHPFNEGSYLWRSSSWFLELSLRTAADIALELSALAFHRDRVSLFAPALAFCFRWSLRIARKQELTSLLHSFVLLARLSLILRKGISYACAEIVPHRFEINTSLALDSSFHVRFIATSVHHALRSLGAKDLQLAHTSTPLQGKGRRNLQNWKSKSWNTWLTCGCEVLDVDFWKDIRVSILSPNYRYYINTYFLRYFPSLDLQMKNVTTPTSSTHPILKSRMSE